MKKVINTKYENRKIEYTDLKNGTYLVKLSSVYDNNCSEQEYQIVNQAVLNVLLTSEHEMEANERKERYYSCCKFDEQYGTEENQKAFIVEEKYSFVVAEERDRLNAFRETIRPIFEKLTNMQRDRLYIQVTFGLSYLEIAKAEGVAPQTIRHCCLQAIKQLKNSSQLLQQATGNGWADLLKSTNFEKYRKFFS